MPASSTHPSLRALAPWIALSGACGLINEILWIRALGLHFGTTAAAVSTVVAAFMGGMALGNAWLGAAVERSERPLRFYSNIELGIAGSALLV